jgi:hypothetical protein
VIVEFQVGNELSGTNIESPAGDASCLAHDGTPAAKEPSIKVLMASPHQAQSTLPRGTGIVQALPAGQPVSAGGIYITYMIALNYFAISPFTGRSLTKGLSIAVSFISNTIFTPGYGYLLSSIGTLLDGTGLQVCLDGLRDVTSSLVSFLINWTHWY